MKKFIAVIMTVFFMLGSSLLLSACSNKDDDDTGKIKVVTTIFPEYDWAKQVVGKETDKVHVRMLLDNGIDLHSYQPSTEDILKIQTCDLFIYVGGESDTWVDKTLKNAVNKNMEVINLLEYLGENKKQEEVVEGMEGDEDEGEDEGEEEIEYDEHVWLSLRNAKIYTNLIKEKLVKILPDEEETFSKNAEEYITKLDNLDKDYTKAVEQGSKNTVIFGDRFPFRYFVDDYNLKYFAAFVGCSAETEASFKTVTFLANKVDELNLSVILTIEGKNKSIATTIKNNTKNKNQEILTLDSMQSTTSSQVKKGTTYYSVMKNNLSIIKKALA